METDRFERAMAELVKEKVVLPMLRASLRAPDHIGVQHAHREIVSDPELAGLFNWHTLLSRAWFDYYRRNGCDSQTALNYAEDTTDEILAGAGTRAAEAATHGAS